MNYTGPHVVTPTESGKTLPTSGRTLRQNVVVSPIPPKFVGSGVKRQAATTITPTEREQIAVPKETYTTGDVKVKAIPSDYIGSGVPRKSSSEMSASGATVTATSPTITLKTPTMSARCSTTYMSTANAGLVDKNNTKLTYTCKVYRVKKTFYLQGFYKYLAARVAEMDS